MKNTFRIFSTLILLIIVFKGFAQAPTYIYFVPLPEQQIHNAFTVLYTSTGTTYNTIISIVPSESNVLIYYDQWEDGYELNLGTKTQTTTQIWGDGNAANGFPPGYPADPPLVAGRPIILENNVLLPRVPTTILYDGRDKFGSSCSLAVTRSSWAINPGPVLADAIEFYNTKSYGNFFYFPIGQTTIAAGVDNSFSLVSLCVGASQNATQLLIDKDGNGTIDVTAVINEGESYQVNGGILHGGSVTSNKPVQVALITGRIAATYASRWYNLVPVSGWDKSYYTPVATTNASAVSDVFVFNPQAAALTINYQSNLGNGSFSVPSKGVYRYHVPLNSAAHFHSTLAFYAVGGTDMDAAGNTTWDWGYCLVPEIYLTNSIYVGWGPGCASPIIYNGNPVWVGSTEDIENTTIYIDLDGNPATGALTDINGNKYDLSRVIAPLSVVTIYDNTDKNQTGMHVYTLDGKNIVAAWGEDALTAGPGNPYLDVGTTIPPDPDFIIRKAYKFTYDANSNNLADVGDTIQFILRIKNFTLQPYTDIFVYDTIPAQVTYKSNSTYYDLTPLPDNTSPNTIFPLDQTGYLISLLPAGAKDSITYKTVVKGPAISYSDILNRVVAIDNFGTHFKSEVKVPANYNPTACAIFFTNSGGTTVSSYNENSTIYIKVTDGDNNQNIAAIDSVKVTVTSSTGDSEIKYLLETGINTGDFRNSLTSSKTSGTGANNGTLYAVSGGTIAVSYTDLIYGGTCSINSFPVTGPSFRKYLYLSDTTASGTGTYLDRIKPYSADVTSASTVVLGAVGSSGSVTLNPTQDAFINATPSATTTNYGACTQMGIDGVLTSPLRALLEFNLSPYNGYTITAATLTFGRSDASPINLTFEGHQITSPWTEGTGTVAAWSGGTASVPTATSSSTDVSWANRTGTTAWTTPGGDFNATAIVPSTVFTATPTMTGAGLVSLVQNWVNTPATNYGILIKGTSEASGSSAAGTRYDLYSRTGTTIPTLQISYSSPAPTTATFTQHNAMCSAITLTSGGAVKVKLWLSNMTGTVVSNPAISAILKDNGVAFLTLSSPVLYDQTGTANDTIIWTGTMASNYILAAGHTVSLDVTTTQPSFTFQITYDAFATPSLVRLPVTNVIDIASFGVYNAPNPGGTLNTTAYNGSTVYIRATVSDPFGYYDITSAALRITDPTLANTDVAMTQVAVSGCTKTFEYPWVTGVTQGSYTLRVITNEGYENEVKDTAITTFSLQYLDTGTPCAVDFTDVSGTPLTQYSANGTLYFKVKDMDKNTNVASAESVNIVVTSSTGDLENKTLTETGVNTGIFTGSMTSSTTGPVNNNNGTLYASNGSTIFFSYTDAITATDVCTANAYIFTAAPSLSTIKSRLLPAGLYAKIGDTVRWQITVTNSGNVNLADINMTDTYSNACLTFISASPAQSSIGAGTVTWNTAEMGGSMLIGQTRNFIVTFICASGCGSISNSITATSVANSLTSTATSPVTLDNPVLTMAKTRTSPLNVNIFVDDNITYSIVVTNTGNTIASTVPLVDVYSDYNLQYVSSTLAPTASGSGQIDWANIGPINPLGSVSISVTFKALHGNEGLHVINNASVDFGVDQHGNTIPPVNDTARLYVLNPPIAVDDNYTTILNTPVSGNVTANDSDADGDILTVTPYSGATTHGNVVLNSNGTFTYTPTTGYTGNDSFTYTICDPTAKCAVATVHLTILSCIDPPVRPNNVH